MTNSQPTNGNPRSSCHDAEVINHSSDEGTGYMTCKTCNKPCNPVYVSGLLSEEEVERIAGRAERAVRGVRISGSPTAQTALASLMDDIPDLLADRAARIERNREAIEKLFAKMCELDTPKRGELHLLMISLLS